MIYQNLRVKDLNLNHQNRFNDKSPLPANTPEKMDAWKMNIFLLGYPIFRGYVSRECSSRRFDCAGEKVAVRNLPTVLIISIICSNSVAKDNVEMTTNENGWDTTEVVVCGVLRMFVPVVDSMHLTR